MKKTKKMLSLLCVFCLAVAMVVSQTSHAASTLANGTSEYVYTINVTVSNPVNSTNMDEEAVNVLYFDYYYSGQNGYQSEKKETFDLSWNGSGYNNVDFLIEHFVRPHDYPYSTSFDVTLEGKLNRLYIKLNMDGGERLSFTIESIYCNGKRINNNTDYVSSAYYDSTATIYCSMENSVIDETNSPYFKEHEELEISEKTLNNIVNGLDDGESYVGQLRDQYNAIIDMSVLKNCLSSSDGDINQFYSHRDEESMYKYTFYFDVQNPIAVNNADYDEVETFYIEMSYIDQNGYGTTKTYTLDMSYSSDLKRNRNPKYLSCFESDNDDGYKTHFSVWVPGIVTEIKSKLNMSGEKLSVNFDKVMLGSMAINNNRDYVSSVYFDSDAKITCSIPASQIAVSKENLPEKYSADLTDQYGSIVSETLFDKAKENTQRYLYHS